MKWTKRKPTRPGWYWVKLSRSVRGLICRVSECEGLLFVHYPFDVGEKYELISLYRWAGPIPEPKERKT